MVLNRRLVARDELAAEVRRITGSDALGSHVGQNSWGTLLRPAAFSGLLCFGPSLGQRVRFTHPKSWLASDGAASPIDPTAAAGDITRRFLSTYGPATDRDLACWWSCGSGITIARQWIASLGGDAVQVDLEGTRAWMLAADARNIRKLDAVKSVALLPVFDQYVMAASCHAERLILGGQRARVFRPQGWISPVLLVNGFMHGAWRHVIKGSRVTVTIEPFDKLPAWHAPPPSAKLSGWQSSWTASSSSLNFDQPQSDSPHHRFRPRSGVQLRQNRIDVKFRRVFRDFQPMRDHFVAHPLRQHFDDIHLARR